jgi:hypothetical protein
MDSHATLSLELAAESPSREQQRHEPRTALGSLAAGGGLRGGGTVVV